MPINAELFDGTILEFPDNTDPSVIRATAAKITEEKQIKQNTSNLGDIATAFKQGVVGAGKSLTDIAGADNVASEYLGGIQERLGKQYRPQRIEEMQKRQQIIDEAVKSGSTLEEIKAYLGGVTEAPIQSIAQAAGSFAPYVAAGGLGAGARLAGLVVPSARAINTGLGALQGTGAIKGSIYENVKRELEAKGESPEVAAEKAAQAQAYSLANAPQLGLGAVLGAAAGRYGAESLVTPGVATRLNANMLPRAGMAALSEAPFEGLQAGQEQYATNLALAREGFDVDPMQGVIGSAARDAAIGAITAAPIGAISRGEKAPPAPVLEPTKAQEPEEKAKQSDPNIYNPAVRESAPQIAAALLPEMKRFGLENVGLKVMDSIENGRADGMWANNLIHVALDKPNPMGSMRHESIHALKQLGGFQDNEWSALNNKAKSEWLKTFIKDTGKYEQYKKIYQQDNKTLAGFDSYIQEEAIAEAFRYFDKNGAPEGMIGAIYEKLKLMFEAMRNGFTGAGFQSADSIFRSIESGTREQVAPAGEVLNPARFSKPDTRRLDMNFKQVAERIPELQEAMAKMDAGKMTGAQYDKLVNRYKPIIPYDFVPTPATKAEAVDAIEDKETYGIPAKTLKTGHPVGLRLDIPAYTRKGVWVPTVHEQASGFGAGKKIGHESIAELTDATFGMSEKAAASIAGGKPKGTIATIKGNWKKSNEKTAVAKAQAALNDPDWTQVGMDPERHSYFYDRKTTQPILSADEVIQIGPLVLAKNAKFGSKKDFKYSVDPNKKPEKEIKARTMQDLNEAIPAKDRVVSKDPTKLIDGNSFLEADLNETGAGFLPFEEMGETETNRAIMEMWNQSIEESGGNFVRDIVKDLNATPPTAKFLNDAFSLPNSARYWYELSAQKVNSLPLPSQFKDLLINLISATSGQTKPLDNMKRAISILSEVIQNKPVETDLISPKTVENAIRNPDLETLKFGNFAGTMKFVAGMTNKAPTTTNDLQVADIFNMDANAFGTNPVLYEVVSRFYNKVRDLQNSFIPEEMQPYESWQIQALTWVENRGDQTSYQEKTNDDYAQAIDRITKQLADADIPLVNEKIGLSTLKNPNLTKVLRPTVALFQESYKATIESNTLLNKEGKEANDEYELIKDLDSPWAKKLVTKFERIQREAFEKIASDKIVNQLIKAIVGRAANVSRIDSSSNGTYEGKVSPNMRIPMFYKGSQNIAFKLDKSEINVLLAILGKELDQAAMAASLFTPVDGNGDTFRILIPNKTVLEDEISAFDKAVGYPINFYQAPNGGVLEINVGGYETKPTIDQVQNAIMNVFGNVKAKYIESGYDSTYITKDKVDYAQSYEEIINEFRESKLGGSDKARLRTAFDSIVEQETSRLKSIAERRNKRFEEFTEESRKRRAKEEKQQVKGKLSLAAPDTKEFKQWFGNSKIVNSDGSPKVYYHGTAQDITEFKPKQANAIFLTDNPKFAKDFSQLSKHYMEQDAFNSASQEEKIAQLQSVRKLLEEDGRDTDSIAKDIRKLKKGEKLPSDFYIAGGYSDLLDYVNRDNAGAENILPVFVKANNPFDYQNIKDIEKVLKVATPEEMQPILQRASYNPDRLKRIIGEGSWNTIESPQFQSAVRRAGFDAFYVSEGGNKNLAVYDSSQIKSFTNQAPTESKDIRFSVALDSIAPDTFLTSDKNPNALGNLGFMPTNSPFPKRPIRLQIGTRGNEKGKAYGAKHILERALTDVAHRPVAVTKEALEDTILHIESLSKRFNRVYADGKQFILYDAQTDDAMVVTPMNGFYGVTTMYSNPNVQRRYGNPKWSGRNVQPPIEETGLKVQGISVRANEEGDIVQSEVPKAFKQPKAITPSQIEEQAQNLPRKTGTLGVKKKLSLAPNAPPQGTFTTLLPNESAGKRLTDTITNVVDFFKDPERRIKARIAFVDPNSGLARSLKDSPSYDANGVLRADLLARGKAQTINIIRNGLQTGIPIINSDGTVIIQRDDVNNLANSQAIADRLNDNQYVKDSDLSGRGYVAEVARALRGKEIMQEDAAFNKTQKNIKNHVNREKQIKPEQIAWAEQQIKNVPELEQIFDIWKNVNTGLLNLWEEVGLLDKKQADEYRSKKYYVSLAASNADLEEMMENQLGYTAAGLKSTPKIHKLKGSSDLERNIWENIDKQYASMLAGAYQNQVRKVAVEQLVGAGAASIPSRMKNGKTVGAPLAEGINLRYKDPTNPLADNKGVVHVIVDNPVDLAAFETHHYELSPLLKFFGGATNVLRAGALINPMFWIRQLIRDPIHAALVANSGITTPFHSAKEFINVLANNSPEARILAERGVIGQYDSTLDLHTYLEQTGKEQLPKGNLNKLFHKLMQIHEASDASTRIAIFKKEKEAGLNKGMTEEQATNFAVMKARESINFMIHGNSKSLNALRQMIPFLSASITSLDTVYRAATGYNLPPAEKAAAQKLFKQRAALMLGSSIAYAMLMQDDDEYKKLPDYIKDNNWLIKNPLGEGFIKVAVPYEVGFLFKTLPEVAIRGLAGNSTGKEMLKSYKDGFLHNLPTGGVPVPQAIKPALEVITNYSFFTGNPIESIGESRLPIEMRGRNASETAKFLSQSGLGAIGLSPAKIDALMQGYLAEAGTFSFSLADQLITTVQGKEPTSKNLAKQPFFKAFLTDPNSNKAVADFYQIEQTANQVAQEFSTMTKTGLGKEAVELMQDEDKRKLMASAPALRRVATSMTAIRKAIEATNNNQNIPPDDRREMVNKLTSQYNRVAEQGVKLANTLGIR